MLSDIITGIFMFLFITFVPLGIYDLKMILDIRKKGYHDTKKYRYTRVRKPIE